MSRSLKRTKLLLLSSCTLALCLVIVWIVYGLFGHHLIETLYKSESIGIINKLLEGRTVIPLEHYQQKADKLMILGSVWILVSFLLLAMLVSNPLGIFLTCFGCFFSFSLLFIFLDAYPSLINSLHLDFIDYYAYRANYVPDDILVYKGKPLVSTVEPSNSRGRPYSRLYNIEAVVPRTIEWSSDEDGFRNRPSEKFADVVILGDSFMEYGDSMDDTFAKRLEKKLPGLTVANLGKSGYGPLQYLEVLKRYGINKKPRYVICGIYEGNDIHDIEKYLIWQRGNKKVSDERIEYVEVYTALTGNFLQRYNMALMGAIHGVKRQISLAIDLHTSKIWRNTQSIHPSIAVVNVGDNNYKMLFRDITWSRKIAKSTEELLNAEEIIELRKMLNTFKSVSEQHGIVPLVLYIPTATHIYAQYSTLQSGSDWLQQKPERVRNKENLENAILNVAQELHLETINLSTVFEDAAREGEMLYYALDPHWNAEGRELAATFVGRRLRDRLAPPSGSDEKK